jgi:LAO/AO transport system kinase
LDDSINYLLRGVQQEDRIALSRAITLVESKHPSHQKQAEELLEAILPKTGNSFRLGITGVPGVGKSTFIDAFGSYLTALGKKVAVLSIDPSSTRTKGSILGDKTRMERLSRNPSAFVRPSPSANQLGGVAQKTRESILLCEAAGYDVVIVETVGVGQSETAVHDMVDFFLLLMLSGGGDELQGIKRGIMEMADMILINKVDGENMKAGARAKKEYKRAVHLFPENEKGWNIPVETVSSTESRGLSTCWNHMTVYLEKVQGNGYLEKSRSEQTLAWFREALRQKLEQDFYEKYGANGEINRIIDAIRNGSLSIRSAISNLLKE